MSIPEYNGAAAAAAVIMSHTMRGHKILFVEAPSDGRVLEPLFDNSFTAIAAKGVAGVLEAVSTIEKYNVKKGTSIDVLGFIDKDYLHLRDDNGILGAGRIVTTMYRDIEIDLLHTPALKKLLKEKASSGKWSCEAQVANDVLSSLSKLSLLRAYNALNCNNWDFKSIDLSKYTSTTGELNYPKLEKAFRQKNHIQCTEWEAFETWASSVDLCLKSITRGHDAACVLGQMLRKKLGNRKNDECSCEVVEENLRLSVEKKFIEICNWFQALREWAYNNLINRTENASALN